MFICSRHSLLENGWLLPHPFCFVRPRSDRQFHNSSTSASRAARQLGWSLEPDRQGVKLSKDLRSFRITLWHSKRRVTFTTFPIALFCLPVSYWYVSARLARPWRAEGGGGGAKGADLAQRRRQTTVVKLRTRLWADVENVKLWDKWKSLSVKSGHVTFHPNVAPWQRHPLPDPALAPRAPRAAAQLWRSISLNQAGLAKSNQTGPWLEKQHLWVGNHWLVN